jgi:ABC-type amino acid transport substrate-binding protein
MTITLMSAIGFPGINELFNAMIGGSLDMLSTGAVISNFPARGQGKAFLINNIEFATAQLWIREDQGVKTWADLKGRKIATTLGTTAHVFLDAALRANGLDPAKDVELVNQGMPVAVTSFISGAVPAVALRSRRVLYGAAALSALAEPAGAMLGLAATGIAPGLNAYFLAFAAGAMTFGSIHELIPMARRYGHTGHFLCGIAAPDGPDCNAILACDSSTLPLVSRQFLPFA